MHVFEIMIALLLGGAGPRQCRTERCRVGPGSVKKNSGTF
jgi:hypothetical protein